MTLGERLKATRETRGLNLTQAAAELGVARTAYRLWEKDAAAPMPECWNTLALWCQVSVEMILRDLGHIGPEDTRALLELAERELITRGDD